MKREKAVELAFGCLDQIEKHLKEAQDFRMILKDHLNYISNIDKLKEKQLQELEK